MPDATMYLYLKQDPSYGKDVSQLKWLYVQLVYTPYEYLQALNPDRYTGTKFSYVDYMRSTGYSLMGRWVLGVNSIDTAINGSYTLGNPLPKSARFWRYSPKNEQIQFVDIAGNSEDDEGKNVYAKLNGAGNKGEGFVPSDGGEFGNGYIMKGDNMLFNQKTFLNWQPVSKQDFLKPIRSDDKETGR